MKIGIIGAGNVGGTLARHLIRLGHNVSVANSRGPQSLTAFAAEIGARAGSVNDVVNGAEIIILAIPTLAIPKLPRDLFVSVPKSTIIIDTTNYHPELRDGPILAIDQGMLDSQWIEQQIGRPVIKAFNAILATSLQEKGLSKGSPNRIALPVAGNSIADKNIVLGLTDQMGFEPIDAGTIEDSWRQQTGAPAYCQNIDAEKLVPALKAADKNCVPEYRSRREADIRKLISGQ
jgi:8-hydroxy-5-deazaflavin:NADPH oxidoreductase